MMAPGASTIEIATRRWAEILADQPDLAPAVALQRSLLDGVVGLREALAADWSPSLSDAHVEQKLRRGLPALRGEAVPLPATRVAPALAEFCDQLAAGGAGQAATHIREVLDSGRLQASALVAASLGRDQRGVRFTAVELDLSADLLWLIGELAAGPVAHALQQRLFQSGPPMEARLAAAGWDHGYCPICGSWPALAAIVNRERTLLCSLCGAGWQPAVYRCVYCGEDGDRFKTAAPDIERIGRRLEVCGSCGGYLKSLDLPEAPGFPLAAVEDLATTDLDRLAMEQGYGRPPMNEMPL
jgi:FdhE protein